MLTPKSWFVGVNNNVKIFSQSRAASFTRDSLSNRDDLATSKLILQPFLKSGNNGEVIFNNSNANDVDITTKRLVVEMGQDTYRFKTYVAIDITGSHRIVQIDNPHGEIVFNLSLHKSNDGFQIDGLSDQIPNAITINLSDEQLAFLVATMWIGSMINRDYRGIQTSGMPTETQASGYCHRYPDDGVFQISHDLECTWPKFLGGDNFITKDGRLYLYVWCGWEVREIEIRALDCCKRHDIALWCAENNWEILAADEAVIACFVGKAIEQGYGQIGGWCGIFAGGYLQLTAEIASMWALFSILGLLANFTYPGELIGYRGKNRDSCLCRGDVPTIMCGRDPERCNSFVCGSERYFTACCKTQSGSIEKRDNSKRCCEENIENIPECPCAQCCWKFLPNNRGIEEWQPWSPIGDLSKCCAGTPGPRGTRPPARPSGKFTKVCLDV